MWQRWAIPLWLADLHETGKTVNTLEIFLECHCVAWRKKVSQVWETKLQARTLFSLWFCGSFMCPNLCWIGHNTINIPEILQVLMVLLVWQYSDVPRDNNIISVSQKLTDRILFSWCQSASWKNKPSSSVFCCKHCGQKTVLPPLSPVFSGLQQQGHGQTPLFHSQVQLAPTHGVP